MRVQKIGFIGVGKMGGPVARRLATGQFDVRVFDMDPAAAEGCVRAGATRAPSAADAAAGADAVLTSLPLPEHVLGVWTDLAGHLPAGAIAVDLSTIDPATAREISGLLAGHAVPFVSCALGKTPMAAEKGAIPLFVGGPHEAVTRLGPLLERIGDKVYDFGTPEAAVTFKLVSNLIGMTNLAVLAEGYVLARRAGIDPGLFAAALDDTGARSFQSDARLPWLIEGDYAARFGTRLAAKDVRLAVEAAARWELPTPVAAQALSQLLTACAHGHADEDVVAVAKTLDPGGALLRPADQEPGPGPAGS
jgi:3-hydroxyisobutyrate dehydrogenase